MRLNSYGQSISRDTVAMTAMSQSKKLKLAFVGFRHGHILGLYDAARKHPDVEVVAAAEEDSATADALASAGKVHLTHHPDECLAPDFACDAIAIGDYFENRGRLIIAALKANRHVISDKPICTHRSELDEIERLARANQRVVGCLLDLRDTGAMLTMRRLIGAGAIGEVHTCTITAQHPLMLERRAAWYFEPGKQGGTINDIGIHAIDLIPWLTGRRIAEVVAARAWNARLGEHPDFQDAAQFMLRLDNNGGVLADVSYLSPDGIGYAAPQYWRVTCHGAGGWVEAAYDAKSVLLARAADKSVESVPSDPGRPQGCLKAFLAEIAGHSEPGMLGTTQVLDASRRALVAQEAADRNLSHVMLSTVQEN
jgi:predicted dehydrogenase